MNNLALYRKYRPKTFTDVSGQDTVTRILKNQIKMDRIGHAYLFSGIRGTGKTTIAKVFAKAVNCLNPQDGNPCGVCKNCQALDQASTMDIIEIDAASNRGVDEIRDLKETISYPPTIANYKVYIIDEVHMLTNEAFNALLKTLEEPPEHAIFLLATTEPEKLPATILSRCQKYNIKPIPDNTIIDRMKLICQKEGVNIEDKALEEISKRAGHSMRDALSILDQCVDLQNKGDLITLQEVDDFLGISPKEEIIEIARAQSNKDAISLLKLLNDFRNIGRDDRLLLEDLSEFYKEFLYYKITGETDSKYKTIFEEINHKISFDELYHILDVLLEAHNKLKFNVLSTIITDTALLNLCTDFETQSIVTHNPVQIPKEVKNNYKEPRETPQPTLNKEPVNDPEPYFPDEYNVIEPNHNISEPIEPEIPPFEESPNIELEQNHPIENPESSEPETHSQVSENFNIASFKKEIIKLAQKRKENLLATLLENAEFKYNRNGLFILIEERHKFMFNTLDFQQKLQNMVNEVTGEPTRVYPKIKEQYYAFLNQKKAQKSKKVEKPKDNRTLEQKVKEAIGDDSIVYETIE